MPYANQPFEIKTENKKTGVELADIFREHGDEFRRDYPTSPHDKKIMRLIELCRTAEMGGHIEQCDACGEERRLYNSCCNRHCPKCQTFKKEKWLMDRQAELLPVKYFHNIFTLPHEINPIALNNRAVVYNLLFRASSQTLLEFGKDPKFLGGKLGFISILHTWDQKLLSHIHLHFVIPAGALSFDKNRWIPCRYKKYLFPVKALSKAFQGKFIDFLQNAFAKGELIFPGNSKEFGTKEGFKGLIKSLWKKKWVVYSKSPFKGPEKVMDYLGRYTHKVAISNHRILSLENGKVTFKYRDRKDADKVKTMPLKALEFIRRFLLHILPSGFMRIRHFGFLANRYKKENIERCRELLGTRGEPDKKEESTLEVLERILGIDITKCPRCKEGNMVIIKVLHGREPNWRFIDPKPRLNNTG